MDAETAWAHFESATGLTRTQYEAMERAVEFVRGCAVALPPYVVPHSVAVKADAILADLDGKDDCMAGEQWGGGDNPPTPCGECPSCIRDDEEDD